MSNNYEAAVSDFVTTLDQFKAACAALDAEGRWDADKYGAIDAYFKSDIAGAMLCVMSSDGQFEEPEARLFNQLMGTDYTAAGLRSLFKSLKPVVSDYCGGEPSTARSLLEGTFPEVWELYRTLIIDACDAVSQSDEAREFAELSWIEKIKESLA